MHSQALYRKGKEGKGQTHSRPDRGHLPASSSVHQGCRFLCRSPVSSTALPVSSFQQHYEVRTCINSSATGSSPVRVEEQRVPRVSSCWPFVSFPKTLETNRFPQHPDFLSGPFTPRSHPESILALHVCTQWATSPHLPRLDSCLTGPSCMRGADLGAFWQGVWVCAKEETRPGPPRSASNLPELVALHPSLGLGFPLQPHLAPCDDPHQPVVLCSGQTHDPSRG